FSIFNFGTLIGSTSPVTTDTNHTCGSFPTACLNDPNMSHGSFALSAGNYSLTIQETHYFEDSFVAWFNVTTSALPGGGGAAVPEPATLALVGSALFAAGFIRRKRR